MPASPIPVALQLWSVREDMKCDFAATVAEVARIGYAGVELAGYGNLDAKGAKGALDAAGLKVAGMHVNITSLRTSPETIIADALLFGTRHVTISFWSPEQFVSVAAVEKIAEE
ncbi:MAG TPA: sugar phosphate isomerase/epimerase, partial [Opitutus sp.]|nr:sugar phosphate isomerase/epimerase [Opitutus sp.]